MAKVEIAPEMLAQMLFGFAEFPVKIEGLVFNPNSGVTTIEIAGDGVPDAEYAHAIFTLQTNRAGDRMRTMRFEPI